MQHFCTFATEFELKRLKKKVNSIKLQKSHIFFVSLCPFLKKGSLQVWYQQVAVIFIMAKKTLLKKDKVRMLTEKLSEAIDSCKLKPTEELDIFAEAVAVLIAYWGKESDWTPLQKASYVGYVITTVMEKGLDVAIKDFEEFRKSMV